MHRQSTFIAFGALVGLAWSAALRAYMAELAGFASAVDWIGTFAQILLPGTIIGALLGWAECIRRVGGIRGWRWLAAAPILLFIAPLLSPGAVEALVTTGIGGGALGVPLGASLLGYGISRRGPLWARIVCGVVGGALSLGIAIAGSFIRPDSLSLTEPRGVWIALLGVSLMLLFALACSIPHRSVVAHEDLPLERASS